MNCIGVRQDGTDPLIDKCLKFSFDYFILKRIIEFSEMPGTAGNEFIRMVRMVNFAQDVFVTLLQYCSQIFLIAGQKVFPQKMDDETFTRCKS